MNKKSRTLLITVISFVVLIVVASVAYNALRESTPSVAFTPQVAAVPQQPAQAPSATNQSSTEPSTEQETAEAEQSESAEPAETESEEPKMPNLPFFTLDGEEILFEDIRKGKPVVINYFASWCPPCKEELPHFQRAFDEYGDRISFIFLNAMDGQRETKATLETFVKQTNFTGPIYTDEGPFGYVFQTNSLPTT
ncbi:MAG: redoxin domain-containing protein, partial [Spirochaetia bacterium]|nr:redoxin domain-containing protein [Spirochaetia bacterium]